MSDEDKLGPPPVEPMSDVTWARVERGLWSRIDSGATDELPAPRRRWLWVAVPAFAVAAIALLLLATGVFSARDDAPVMSVVEPMEPSRVVAGAAPSTVSFGDAHIDLAAQSAIVMTREGDSPSVLLERGSATFAVAPRNARAADRARGHKAAPGPVPGLQCRAAAAHPSAELARQVGRVNALLALNTMPLATTREPAWPR